jgi:hypothetical protein
MKDSQIEVIFSEREYDFMARYSKENRVDINEVVRSNLAAWLQKWDLSDMRAHFRKGAVIVRGRQDGKRHSFTITAVGSDGADWFKGQITDESLSDEPTEPAVQPSH